MQQHVARPAGKLRFLCFASAYVFARQLTWAMCSYSALPLCLLSSLQSRQRLCNMDATSTPTHPNLPPQQSGPPLPRRFLQAHLNRPLSCPNAPWSLPLLQGCPSACPPTSLPPPLPLQALVNQYGADAVRYYLMREIVFGWVFSFYTQS